MKAGLTEGKFLVYSTLAILLLMATHLFQPQLNSLLNPDNSVGIHTLLESISISISATIFFYGFKNYCKTRSSRMLLISFTFLIVGTLDLLHTLSFKGMPFFLTESSVEKATWFWVTARVTQALLILAILLVPDRKLNRDYRALVFLFGMIIAWAIGLFIIFYEKRLPQLMVEGKGTTTLKNMFEYAVSIIQFLSLIITLYQYYMEKREATLSVALALVFMLLTDLIFTIYHSILDFDNFSGHIFKTLGFLYILKGFYFLESNETQERNGAINQELIRKQPGLNFIAEKQDNEFLLTTCTGELLHQIGIEQQPAAEQLAGVFPANKSVVEEYFRMSLQLQEPISFELSEHGIGLLISVKPYTNFSGIEYILGTVLELPSYHFGHDLTKKNPEKKQLLLM